ncbi:lycopene cyclase [Streptomyces bathyalis]|uniref:Lycopene cyclase n=1 Tax=Streptomyces bathyalis TaxID=2710756 RepID=A0A7T1T733_9ACTN|nr:lycopene cyclase family protein [Streptomyces bathyalis]QPP07604.1 lycopene cyclase [Streptomyces bathyalis]
MTDTDADADVVVVGAGASGLSLAWRLVSGAAGAGRAAPRVLLVEPPPGPLRSPERTWCFWEEGPGEFDDLLTAAWTRLSVTDGDGRTTTGACGTTYKMLRSTAYTRELGARLASSAGVRRVTGTVTGIRDVPGGGETTGVDADGRPFRLLSRWVFDSRPPRRLPPARTTLLQHFRGWFVQTRRACFDPSVAQLMDFRTPQPPPGGLAFVYLLPLSEDEALVEYTVFSTSVASTRTYETALRRYLEDTRRLGDYTVTETEHGVIPMTDGVFRRRAGRSVFRIGAAGGAVRPSTGYAFAALQRQATAVAAAYGAGRTPLPPEAHSWRHRTMDAVLLRALATGRIDGGAFFTGLFRRNPLDRVLHFLEGRSTPAQEWAIGLRAPVLPMVRTLGELPFVPLRAVQAERPSSGVRSAAVEHGGVQA